MLAIGFTVGVIERENVGAVPTDPFGLQGGLPSEPRFEGDWKELKNYAVRPVPGRTWEMGAFLFALSVLSPGV